MRSGNKLSQFLKIFPTNSFKKELVGKIFRNGVWYTFIFSANFTNAGSLYTFLLFFNSSSGSIALPGGSSLERAFVAVNDDVKWWRVQLIFLGRWPRVRRGAIHHACHGQKIISCMYRMF